MGRLAKLALFRRSAANHPPPLSAESATCDSLIDVSALAGATRVSLQDCSYLTEVTDVSALGGVRVLGWNFAPDSQMCPRLAM